VTVEENGFLKDVELKLVAELMKNSRRSDRELGKAIGTSQPTVSRTIARLKREGGYKRVHGDTRFRQVRIPDNGFHILQP
jgi:DNA-binding Lrp family transcriptional regulator